MDEVRKLLMDLENDNYIKHMFGKRIAKALTKLDATGGVDQTTLDLVAAANEAIGKAAARLGARPKSARAPKPADTGKPQRGGKLTSFADAAAIAAESRQAAKRTPRAPKS